MLSAPSLKAQEGPLALLGDRGEEHQNTVFVVDAGLSRVDPEGITGPQGHSVETVALWELSAVVDRSVGIVGVVQVVPGAVLVLDPSVFPAGDAGVERDLGIGGIGPSDTPDLTGLEREYLKPVAVQDDQMRIIYGDRGRGAMVFGLHMGSSFSVLFVAAQFA